MIAGAKIDAGAWLKEFEIYIDSPTRIEHEADGCDWSTDVMADGSDMLEVWNTIQGHMFDAHLGDAQITWNGETTTVVPGEYLDEILADAAPPVPNQPTQDAFQQLDETVEHR
jgi:hypothetical protein